MNVYLVGDRPVLPGSEPQYLQEELRRIASALRDAQDYAPQPAISAPSRPRDGMQRLARAPWRPVGGTEDVWVYFDGPSNTWKRLPSP
ncbi:hypothetical protein RQ734_15265 [Roseomonas mucosa]|uniref:hypothetical protein n=1 Tax=Roseomonas mucosa TaxID=207340 RepID=UPI0028CF9F5E|nr:hypothetical protein [Roseomonas mucosa]MDT8277431.1 hypothetical protein [Roseomonas mucosa]